MPRVSVIIPSKDRPDELRNALNSLAAQTATDFEVVVTNDGGCSLDSIEETFRDKLNLTVLNHETNQGAGAARNTAYTASSGDYVAYLDDDDVFRPDHIETLSNFLAEHESVAAVYSDAELAKTRMGRDGPEIVNREVVHSRDFCPDALLVYNYMPTLTIMHRRKAAALCGRFDPSLRILQDWDYWIRLSRKHAFAHLPKVTAQYRRLERTDERNNLTAQKRNRFIEHVCRIYLRYRQFAEKNPEVVKEQAAYLTYQTPNAIACNKDDAHTLARLVGLEAATKQFKHPASFFRALGRFLD